MKTVHITPQEIFQNFLQNVGQSTCMMNRLSDESYALIKELADILFPQINIDQLRQFCKKGNTPVILHSPDYSLIELIIVEDDSGQDFTTIEKAMAFFKPYFDFSDSTNKKLKLFINAQISTGEISIGPPKVNPGQKININSDGRYFLIN